MKIKFTLNLFVFLIGVSIIIPHHPLVYIWSPPSKPILFPILFVWCRPGYVGPYLDVWSFKPVASFDVLAKPDSAFNPNNGAVNHSLESPY